MKCAGAWFAAGLDDWTDGNEVAGSFPLPFPLVASGTTLEGEGASVELRLFTGRVVDLSLDPLES